MVIHPGKPCEAHQMIAVISDHQDRRLVDSECGSGLMGKRFQRTDPSLTRADFVPPHEAEDEHKSPATCQKEHANGSTSGTLPRRPWLARQASSNRLGARLKSRTPPDEAPQTTSGVRPGRGDRARVRQAGRRPKAATYERQNEREASKPLTQLAKGNDQRLRYQCRRLDQRSLHRRALRPEIRDE